jgi:site-specific recombinase XerD
LAIDGVKADTKKNGIFKLMTLPSRELLNEVQRHILERSNKVGESKKSVHYGLFLLCSQAGLRVSEAVNFDLTRKNKQGLYKVPTKKKPMRYVFIPAEVISKLKANN